MPTGVDGDRSALDKLSFSSQPIVHVTAVTHTTLLENFIGAARDFASIEPHHRMILRLYGGDGRFLHALRRGRLLLGRDSFRRHDPSLVPPCCPLRRDDS